MIVVPKDDSVVLLGIFSPVESRKDVIVLIWVFLALDEPKLTEVSVSIAGPVSLPKNVPATVLISVPLIVPVDIPSDVSVSVPADMAESVPIVIRVEVSANPVAIEEVLDSVIGMDMDVIFATSILVPDAEAEVSKQERVLVVKTLILLIGSVVVGPERISGSVPVEITFGDIPLPDGTGDRYVLLGLSSITAEVVFNSAEAVAAVPPVKNSVNWMPVSTEGVGGRDGVNISCGIFGTGIDVVKVLPEPSSA